MKNKRLLILIAVLMVLVVAGAGILLAPKKGALSQKLPASNTQNVPPPLVVNDYMPIGLIGTITALGTNTVTIQGQPPGNTVPVALTLLVDAKTSITRVGPSPAYATSTATFADFKKGILLNISATAVQNGVRHADRIIIPPPTK
jgi:hypothetical protein